MKRLLLSQGRTGSLNLTRFIRESNKNELIVYREPFNTTAIKDTNISFSLEEIIKTKNSFVENKIGKGSLPEQLQSKSYDQIISYFKKNFDIIGFLSRKDFYSQTQSVINAKISGNWSNSYHYKDFDISKFSDIETQLKEERETIKILSDKYGIPIFYYENLYEVKQTYNLKLFCNYFYLQYNENNMKNYMDKKNRYRINDSKKIL